MAHWSPWYVKPGLVDRTLGRRLNQALESRNHARYHYRSHVGPDEAGQVISLAQELIALAPDRMKA